MAGTTGVGMSTYNDNMTTLLQSAQDAKTANDNIKATQKDKNHKSTGKSNDDYTTPKDTVEIGSKKETKKSTYASGNEINNPLIDKLKKEASDRLQGMKDLVEKVLKQQGNNAKIGAWDGKMPLKDYMNKVVEGGVDDETVKAAQEAISEDGYWGAKKTSQRILDFAEALIGDDPTQIAKMRAAVEEGFKISSKLWGDELPDVSKQTYDLIMKKFDEWEKNGTTKPVTTDATADSKSNTVETVSKTK